MDYWSCSKLANWIRGTPKPFALEWKAWDIWHEQAKKKHPFRYWIAEEFLNKIQDFINLPIDIYHTIEIYIRNRFIDKIHYLKTGLKPGEYYDLDYRILNGLFYELVEFVEVEQAHLMKCYEKEKKYKFIKGRCPQAGLDYLDWACNLKLNEDYGISPDSEDYGKPTEQAEKSKIILKLYHWWKNRPNRKNPYDIIESGQSENWHSCVGIYSKADKIKLANQIDEEYYQEDTNMLIELIKNRRHLWI